MLFHSFAFLCSRMDMGTWSQPKTMTTAHFIMLLFLNERARDCAYFIDKEEEYIRLTGKKSEKDYSLRISDSRCLAPARAQAAASFFILEKSPGADISCFLKILAFLSHQISQIIKRERERIAFRGTCSLEVMLVHHCRVSSLGLHCCGHRAGCAVQDATRLHTLLVKRHSTRR